MTDDNSPMDAGTSHHTAVVSINTAVRALLYGCKTPDDIAEKLLDMGCDGRRLYPQTCPLARYLRIELVNDAVHVSHRKVRVRYHVIPDVVVALPPLLSWFISNFDTGSYPKLLRGRGGA